MILSRADVENFINDQIYDITVSHNGRWIDQKCTADVVCMVADCVLQHIDNSDSQEFSSVDIWQDEYTAKNVQGLFSKPGVLDLNAKNEYDKFFAQPLELLSAAHVLNKKKIGNKNFYQVANNAVLFFISIRETNALFFLQKYIRKTLTDSGIIDVFDDFFRLQTKETYKRVKKVFSSFTISNTNINGEVECNRIFIKVLNPLSFENNLLGTQRGGLSSSPITYDMLMYNRCNFRDIYVQKPKGIARKIYAIARQVQEKREKYLHYQCVKAKNIVRQYNIQCNSGYSECPSFYTFGEMATHMHHIFPRANYPEISGYCENIIALTPTQHFNHAHNNGNANEINDEFQEVLLFCKSDVIEKDVTQNISSSVYSFKNFVTVLSEGFQENIFGIAVNDFLSIRERIKLHYDKILMRSQVSDTRDIDSTLGMYPQPNANCGEKYLSSVTPITAEVSSIRKVLNKRYGTYDISWVENTTQVAERKKIDSSDRGKECEHSNKK